MGFAWRGCRCRKLVCVVIGYIFYTFFIVFILVVVPQLAGRQNPRPLVEIAN